LGEGLLAAIAMPLEGRPGGQPTTPVVQAAKEATIPALYFTNLISARPLMGPAGAGSLATVINAAMGNKGRFDEMKSFFDGVGEGHAAGAQPDDKVRIVKQLPLRHGNVVDGRLDPRVGVIVFETRGLRGGGR
jgi:hypothetical protein